MSVKEPSNTPDELQNDELVGARLAGRYRLEKVLGRGGMGVVYEAVQEDLGRRVAVKLITGSISKGVLARLRLEAEVTASLGNPHVVQVTDFQTNAGEPPFLVMELLNGQSLRALLRTEGTVGWQRAAHFGCQILEALEAAHTAQLIHRDIKPDNIFVLSSAAVPDMIKVLDFGVAKLVAEDARGMTAPGALVGTLAYLAPEVTRGESIDLRADLYALGVTLYEAVAGRRPIVGHDTASLFLAIARATPPPLQSLCPQVPGAFASVVMRALCKAPRDRFQRASEMAAALKASLGPAVAPHLRDEAGGVQGAPPPATARTNEANATGLVSVSQVGGSLATLREPSHVSTSHGAPSSAAPSTTAPSTAMLAYAGPSSTGTLADHASGAPGPSGVSWQGSAAAMPGMVPARLRGSAYGAPQYLGAQAGQPPPYAGVPWWVFALLIGSFVAGGAWSVIRFIAARDPGRPAAVASAAPPPSVTTSPKSTTSARVVAPLASLSDATLRARIAASGFEFSEEESSKTSFLVVTTFKGKRAAKSGAVVVYRHLGSSADAATDLTERAARAVPNTVCAREGTIVLMVRLDPSGAQELLDAIRR